MGIRWMRRLGVLLLLLAGVGLLAWRFWPHRYSGVLLQNPRPASDFTLTAHTGERVRLSDFRGKVVVIYFGYTFCPDVCPTTLARLAKALERMGKDAEKVQVLMITVDPERDTPERLANYVPNFHPSFLGLTGTPEEIAQVAAAYGIFFQKQEGGTAAGYLMDHTASLNVIDRDGYLVLLFPYGTPAEAIASDLKALLR